MENNEIRVIFISDFGQKGSGYLRISAALCQGLKDLGFDVKALGLGYEREEHFYTFSLLPCVNSKEVEVSLHNLNLMWQPHVVVCAMDVPYQATFGEMAKKYNLPYICITPLESDPLCPSWAITLAQLGKLFMISEFAVNECKKMELPAEHLQVGMDVKSWRQATKEEKLKFRESIGIDKDEFVILTVADNQERKNLGAAFEIVGQVKKQLKKTKLRYILVTREHTKVGWNIRDLAITNGINKETIVMERGLDFKLLWSVYALSDLFLITSKAEGLCMPVLEAMSVGLPVVATKTGALIEHLIDGKGFLVEPEYITPPDPWGNSHRYFISRKLATRAIVGYYQSPENYIDMLAKARKYVESRTWDIPIEQLRKAIVEVVNVEEKQVQ